MSERRTGMDHLFTYALEVGAARNARFGHISVYPDDTRRNPQRVVPGGAEPVARNPIDSDEDYCREYAAAEAADNPESSANLDDAPEVEHVRPMSHRPRDYVAEALDMIDGDTTIEPTVEHVKAMWQLWRYAAEAVKSLAKGGK